MKIRSSDTIFSEKRPPIISLTAVILLGLIVAAVILLRNTWVFGGDIEPLMLATATATRTANSFLEEGEAYFQAGDLNKSIAAYTDALTIDPENVAVLTELARIQTYSSAMLTPEDKRVRLQEAIDNIDLAVSLDDFDSSAHAVRILAYDWFAGLPDISLEERESALAEAARSASRAIQLDNQNVLAIAYRAELLADQLQFTQARQAAELALSLDPNLMDTHRIYAYILEATGNYSKAIEEYKIAAEIMPNLTFLYISIGQNYRQLQLYDQALLYFDKAANINETLNIQDPLPFVAIAKTYSRQGEFFAAARNAQRALDFDPTNPDLYGQLGVIYFRSRNYEGSIPALQCAIEGCTAEENEEQEVAVVGLPLNNSSVVYYYTYGSVLAALNQCTKAQEILQEVAQVYSGDETIMSIVQESLFICDTFGSDETDGNIVPEAVTPEATETEYEMMDQTATP